MSDRDYFDGCHNRPMFDAERVESATPPAADAPAAVDIVRAIARETRLRVEADIAAKRDCMNGGQLALPDEFMPVEEGRLFS